jgi:O-antigen/teichoic acid export membrane protein
MPVDADDAAETPPDGPGSKTERMTLMFLGLFDQALVSAASYMTTAIVGRVSKEELGLFGFGVPIALAMLSIIESLFGAPMVALIRRRGDPKEFVGSVLLGLGVVCVPVTLAIATLATIGDGFLGGQGRQSILFALALTYPFFLLRMMIRRSLFATFRFREAVILDSVCFLIQGSLLGVLFASGNLSGAWAHLIVGLSSAVVATGWLLVRSNRYRISWSAMKSRVLECWEFAKSIVFSQLYWVLHINLLLWGIAYFLGTEQVAEFLACLSTMLLANPIVLGLLNLLGPQTSRRYESDGVPGLRSTVFSMTVSMTALALVLWLVLFLGGEQLLTQVFGSEYRGLGSLIAILGISMIAETACKGPEQGLIAIERPDLVSKVHLGRLILTGCGVLLLIRPLGVVGAAVSLGIADCFGAVALAIAFVQSSSVVSRDQELP